MKKIEGHNTAVQIRRGKGSAREHQFQRHNGKSGDGLRQEEGLDGGYRGTAVGIQMRQQVKLAVRDKDVEKVTNAIIGAARTDELGDGKIFITDVADAVRIRTGERGGDAI